MEKIFHDEFIEVWLEESQHFLYVKWFSKTEDFSEKQYKDTIWRLTEIITAKRITKWLGEAREFAYTISLELQDWLSKDINKYWVKAGLEKMAIIVPKHFIANLSVEMAVDELQANHKEDFFVTNYFDNLEEAISWLEVLELSAEIQKMSIVT